MEKMVLITLIADGFEADFELPLNEKLEILYPRLLEVIKIIRPTKFNEYDGIVLEKEGKGLASLDHSLADYGICTGSYLTIVQEGKYFG